MKKVLAWLGVFALLVNPMFGFTQKASAATPPSYSYTLEGLVYNNDPSTGSWTTGNLCQGGKGCYSEGDNVPSRLTLTGLTAGTPYSVVIQHDYKDSANLVGYENFNRVGTVLPDQNASGVSVAFLSDVPKSGNVMRNYTLSFLASGDTAVIYWNSLLGINAADWNGAQLHFRLDSGIGGENVGNKEVPISPNKLQQQELPTLTLTKTVDSGTAAPDLWDFNVSPSINGQSTFDIPDGESSVIINNVPDNTYSITETGGVVGYHFSSGDGTNCAFDGAAAYSTVSAGNPATSATCNFHNTKSEEQVGGIQIVKHLDPGTDVSQWNFAITGPANYTANNLADGGTWSETAAPLGTYTITESANPGNAYEIDNYVTSYTCSSEEGSVSGSGRTVSGLELDEDELISCEFTNTLNRGSITVEKYNDQNANGSRDEGEETLGGWQFNLSGTIQTTDETGQTVFGGLLPDTYDLEEVPQSGWILTGINCNSDREDQASLASIDPETGSIQLAPGENVMCQAGNYFKPHLKIEKSNNRSSVLSHIGDKVTYSLIATAGGGTLDDVIVHDTLPKDFKFIPGSSHVVSSDHGDITGSVVEPNYLNNTAAWHLGNMQQDEVVTISYDATIGNTSLAGVYRDNAFISGATLSGDPVVGMAGPIGFITAAFVGTSVQIANSAPTPILYNVIRGDQVITLASATTLPNAGSATWMAFIMAFIVTSLGFVASKLKSKIALMKGGMILLALIALLPLKTFAASGDLNLRVDTIQTPTSVSAPTIGYVVQDVNAENIVVSCFKKGPADASFSLFQTDTFNSTDSAGSRSCNLAPLVIGGTYQIRIDASAPSDSTSATVSFEYISPGPGIPTNYAKSVNACTSNISFTTANDGGKTSGIEVFRSVDKSFVADSSSLVDSFAAGSNQSVSKTYLSPDCGQTYYYALRAFDAAHNTSGLTGDVGFNVITVQGASASTTSTSSSGATSGTPTAGSPSATPGAVQTPSPTTENNSGTVGGATNNAGNVLGAQTENTSAKKNYAYLYYVGGIIVLAALYEVTRKYLLAPTEKAPAPSITVTRPNGKKK